MTALLFLVALLPGARAVADTGPWQLQLRRDTTRLLGVHALFGRFWAVGEHGALFAALDGKFWSRRKPFTDKALYAVSFAENDFGCAVGEGGVIATTEDGGEHWTVQKSPVAEDLRAVSFGNRNVACAAGLKGTLLMTYDGGRSWTRKDVGYGESLFAAAMISAQEAWVVGERGIMLSTEDSGRTWRMRRHVSGEWLYAVSFGGGAGWTAGQHGLVLRYLMKSWEVIPVPGAGQLTAAAAAGQNGAVVGGQDGRTWATGDAGMTWKSSETTISREDLAGVAFSGPLGWAVGPENALLNTLDGGQSWATVSLENLPSFTAASFADGSYGWVTGGGGLLWTTRDGGRNWGQQETGVKKDLLAVCAVSRSLCFVSGDNVIVKTDDGGATWRRVFQVVPSQAELDKPKDQRAPLPVVSALSFFDARRGWAGGSDGGILYSSNEGESWARVGTVTPAGVNALWFTTPSRGLAACADGQVYATENAGRTWIPRAASGGGEPLRAIFLADADAGWVVGDGGAILRTMDGGATWKEIRLGGAVSIRRVWFTDRQRGWIVGERGLLMKSWDGGETWVPEKAPVAADFLGMCFASPDAGWIVGDRGVILHYGRAR